MARWSFRRDDDPYRGHPAAGYLQVKEGGAFQIWLTWNGWDFSWITFLKEQGQAQRLVDELTDHLGELSKDTSDEGLQRIEHYLEEITAQSLYPVPLDMEEKIHEDLRQRHGQECDLRVTWPFSESPIRQISSTFFGVWPTPSGSAGVWVTLDAGNSFTWIAFYRQVLDAHWAKLALEHAVQQGAFATAERAENVLMEAVNRSESPVPVEMEEDQQNAIREDFEGTHAQSRASAPEYRRDLSVFSIFYESCMRQADAATHSMYAAMSSDHLSGERYDPYLLQETALMQRLWCLRNLRVYYLEPSGLKMCEALRSPTAQEDTHFPEEPLWIQPLAPLPFRGSLVRGIFVYDGFNRDRVDLLPFPNPAEREIARRYTEQKNGMHQIEIFFDNPQAKTRSWQGKTISFGEYDTRHQSWNRMAEGHECPTGKCLVEQLGDQNVLIQCEDCTKEFKEWTQWFEIFIAGIQGKLRKHDDTTSFEEIDLPFSPDGERVTGGSKAKKGKSDRKTRRYHATIIRYDASYFKPAKRRGKRGSLLESHIVLTTEEALREGALQVDLDGVLIRDTAPRAAHTRTLVHPRFKKSHADVRFKPDMPQLISLSTWKARREARQEALHKQEDVYASAYEEQENK